MAEFSYQVIVIEVQKNRGVDMNVLEVVVLGTSNKGRLHPIR
jgi:hypothetical protein